MAVAVLTEEDLERIIERAVGKALAQAAVTDVLSTADAARYAQRSEDTIRRWIDEGLPAQKRGRSWAIKKADLDRFLAGPPKEGASTEDVLARLRRK
jgi:excisionase family DNA binding protein